jgi:hypothetical protein
MMCTFHLANEGDDLPDVAKAAQQATCFLRAMVRGVDGTGVELSRDELAGMERVCGVIADDLDALSRRMSA